MTYSWLLSPLVQIQDRNGLPVVGGKVYVYDADTENLATIYADDTGTTLSNPVLTDTLGNVTLFGETGVLYDIAVYDSTDLLLFAKKHVQPGTEGGGGTTTIDINAGNGCIVSKNGNIFTISVDFDAVASQADLALKQDKLNAGNNIEITNQNVINVTGRRLIQTIEPLYDRLNDNSWILGIDTSALVSGEGLMTTANLEFNNDNTLITGYDGTPFAGGGIDPEQLSAYLKVSAFTGYSANLDTKLTNTFDALSGATSSLVVSAQDLYNTKMDKSLSSTFYPMTGNPSGFLTSETDWTDTIKGASSNAYNQATAYGSNNFYPLTGNPSGFLTSHQSLAGYATTGALYNTSSILSGAIDYISGNAGKTYDGIAPIVVNNTSNKISANTQDITFGSGLDFTNGVLSVTSQETGHTYTGVNPIQVDNVNNEISITGKRLIPSADTTIFESAGNVVIASQSFPKTGTMHLGNNDYTTTANCVGSSFQVKYDYSNVEISPVGVEYNQAPSVIMSASWNSILTKALEPTPIMPNVSALDSWSQGMCNLELSSVSGFRVLTFITPSYGAYDEYSAQFFNGGAMQYRLEIPSGCMNDVYLVNYEGTNRWCRRVWDDNRNCWYLITF